MYCHVTFPFVMWPEQCLIAPHRTGMVDQRHYFTQIQLKEPMSLLVLLTGVYVTQRQIKLRKTHPIMRDDSKAISLALPLKTEYLWVCWRQSFPSNCYRLHSLEEALVNLFLNFQSPMNSPLPLKLGIFLLGESSYTRASKIWK